MARYIDKLPPKPSGEVIKDIEALYGYMFYLREQINYLISQINKGEQNGK